MLPGCRIIKVIVAFSVLFFLALSTVQAENLIPKPRAPISVTLTPLTDVVQGQPVDFEVQVTAFIDAAKVTVHVALPEGSVLHSGSRDWQGGLLQDQVKTLTFRATLPQRSADPVIVDAAIGELTTPRFFDQAIYKPPQSSAAIAAAVSRATSRTVMRKGVRVEEYTLR